MPPFYPKVAWYRSGVIIPSSGTYAVWHWLCPSTLVARSAQDCSAPIGHNNTPVMSAAQPRFHHVRRFSDHCVLCMDRD